MRRGSSWGSGGQRRGALRTLSERLGVSLHDLETGEALSAGEERELRLAAAELEVLARAGGKLGWGDRRLCAGRPSPERSADTSDSAWSLPV